MCEELDKTINTLVYSNDASASVFGWDFQVNSAIFLALHYLDSISEIKVESNKQDIEISLNDSTKIYAQAKSSRDFSVDRNNKKKIKDGLLSLAKTHQQDSNGLFIYISNIPGVFINEYDMFNNDVRLYNDLPLSIKTQVDNLFDAIKSDLLKKIETNSDKPNTIEKLNYYYNCIEKFNKEKLCFSVIVPYIGSDNSRYNPIVEKIVDILSNYFGLEQNQIIILKRKLLEFYHQCFQLNASTEDNLNISKAIKRKELIWPAVALTIEQSEPNFDEWCNETIDEAKRTEILERINDLNIAYHERFELVTQIMTDYIEYKRSCRTSHNIEKRFANECYSQYSSDFDQYAVDNDIKKYLVIWFLYRVIKNNILISKVGKKA